MLENQDWIQEGGIFEFDYTLKAMSIRSHLNPMYTVAGLSVGKCPHVLYDDLGRFTVEGYVTTRKTVATGCRDHGFRVGTILGCLGRGFHSIPFHADG